VKHLLQEVVHEDLQRDDMDERVRMLGPLPLAPDLRRALWIDFDVESDPAKLASPTNFPTV
jgi:hypothetical protein